MKLTEAGRRYLERVRDGDVSVVFPWAKAAGYVVPKWDHRTKREFPIITPAGIAALEEE